MLLYMYISYLVYPCKTFLFVVKGSIADFSGVCLVTLGGVGRGII